jgi:hypothetical protein
MILLDEIPKKEEIIAKRKAWEHIKALAESYINNCDKALKALEQTEVTKTPNKEILAPTLLNEIKELMKANDLEVKEEEKQWIIKPKKWLGQERFIEVSEMVKKVRGQWVSKGKDSHFEIPKK